MAEKMTVMHYKRTKLSIVAEGWKQLCSYIFNENTKCV